MNEPTFQIVYSPRLGDYESFYDHGWAGRFARSTDASILRDVGAVLMRDWKGAALVGRMPWLMIESLKKFHIGMTQQRPHVHQLVDLTVQRMADEARLSRTQKKRIQEIKGQWDQKNDEELQRMSFGFDPDDIWREFLQCSPEFPQSLWNGQRMCYSAVYHAYENFIQRCVSLGKNEPEYAGMGRQLLKDFKEIFGNELAAACVEHPKITVAREVRNSLAHQGGNATKKVLELQHGLEISDGLIHLYPRDVKALFDLLKEKSMMISEWAKGEPRFSQP